MRANAHICTHSLIPFYSFAHAVSLRLSLPFGIRMHVPFTFIIAYFIEQTTLTRYSFSSIYIPLFLYPFTYTRNLCLFFSLRFVRELYTCRLCRCNPAAFFFLPEHDPCLAYVQSFSRQAFMLVKNVRILSIISISFKLSFDMLN